MIKKIFGFKNRNALENITLNNIQPLPICIKRAIKMSSLDVSSNIDIKSNNNGTVSLVPGILSIVTSFAAVGAV